MSIERNSKEMKKEKIVIIKVIRQKQAKCGSMLLTSDENYSYVVQCYKQYDWNENVAQQFENNKMNE